MKKEKQITSEEFEEIFNDIMSNLVRNPFQVFDMPQVMEFFREYFYDNVLEQWKEEQKDALSDV